MPFIERDFPIEEINRLAVREVNARKPIYLIHKWWARRPGPTFRAIVLASFLDEKPMRLYYQHVNLKEKLGYEPVIFDPFMGGGTTVAEAVRLGAKVIGIDVNPVAWFITKKELEPVNARAFMNTFKILEKAVSGRIKSYYETQCPNGHKSDIMYVFWVRSIRCENCRRDIPLFNSFIIASPSEGYVVFCPKCNHVFTTDDRNVKTECSNPECKYHFIPSEGYVKGKAYKCPHCTYGSEILEAIRKEGKPPQLQMFALEYYCETCDKKGYKSVELDDKTLFEKAKREYEQRKNEISGNLIPSQEIPDGFNTTQVKNFLYKYWAQLFNERQLLCLSLLLEQILKIEDENLREYFVTVFSNSLNANNMMCKYNMQASKLEPLFGHHVLWPPQWPIENNLWGTKYGRGTFRNYIRMAVRALEYANNPYEVKIDSDGKSKKIKIYGDRISAKTTSDMTDLKNTADAMLLATTSENLRDYLPNESVDAVITDPPYYQNIMYSEISDFFYVWLHLALRDSYKEFQSPLVDSRREIVVNKAFGKGQDFYINSMKRCFIECKRVLKKDGPLVMTFHHSSPEAWAAVLKALVESGFMVRSTYPIHSETRSGVHPGIQYDSIISCRKVEENQLPLKPLPTAIFEAEVRSRVETDADRFVEGHPKLSIEDLYVAVMGRALQVLSENYAIMLKSGKTLAVEEVRRRLEDLGEIAFDVLLKKFFARTPDVDRISKIYASVFAGKDYVSLDAIDKITKHGGVNFEVFEENQIIGRKKKSLRKILSSRERKDHVLKKLNSGYALLYIDAAQMLRLAWTEGKFQVAVGQFVRNGIEKNKLESYIRFLAQRTDDVTWRQMAKALEETSVTTLEKWI